ncbi:hypothetical protein L2E82_45338 [Cichorium intybus]|uniref:Uncharacterized protein n=1 Tax=Cichorium intybus TaxID=13427 RepID=A0ACB8ZSL3_CICIN|nr:hypothetical protein L2E82_45338 [Cichorium intybus]
MKRSKAALHMKLEQGFHSNLMSDHRQPPFSLPSATHSALTAPSSSFRYGSSHDCFYSHHVQVKSIYSRLIVGCLPELLVSRMEVGDLGKSLKKLGEPRKREVDRVEFWGVGEDRIEKPRNYVINPRIDSRKGE